MNPYERRLLAAYLRTQRARDRRPDVELFERTPEAMIARRLILAWIAAEAELLDYVLANGDWLESRRHVVLVGNCRDLRVCRYHRSPKGVPHAA